jgi:hypothetical protein
LEKLARKMLNRLPLRIRSPATVVIAAKLKLLNLYFNLGRRLRKLASFTKFKAFKANFYNIDNGVLKL